MFYMPGKKETIGKGIDRYNRETVIIYNPDRPAYWLPVSIREAFRLHSITGGWNLISMLQT